MNFLHSNSNTEAIRNLFQSIDKIKCAVSFWGWDSSNYITGDFERIKIVCNLESGATNPYLIESLLEKGVQIKSNAKLHTKVYLAGFRLAIVGSSNASANGLSFEDDEISGWLEASILVEEESIIEEINEWFDSQWECASDINPEMLENAKEKWGRRRNTRDITNHGSIFLALRDLPYQFKDKNIYISIYRLRNASNEAIEAFEQERSQEIINHKLTFWEGWSELPADSYFISIYYGPRGGFSFEGYYYVPHDKSDYIKEIEYKDGSQGDILICFLKKSINGLTISADDINLLRERIEDLWLYKEPETIDEAVYLSLYESRQVLFPMG